MKYTLIYFLFIFSLFSCSGNNNTSKKECGEHVPLADPFILLHNDIYYAYGTFSDSGIVVFTSDDLKVWEQKALALDKKDSYGDKWFWAPEVYYIDGKFYMYYSAEERICVATSDSPLGPFKQDSKEPMFDERSIDNSLFIDDDGTPYLFFDRFNDGLNVWVAELEKDLITMKMETLHPCIKVSQDWEEIWPKVNEGPFVIKHEGIYYMTYSANSYESPYYGIGCATATRITGEWTKYQDNPLLSMPGELVGTGHHCIFTDKDGKLRLAFHAHKDKENIHPREMYITSVSLESVNGQTVMRISPDYITPVLKTAKASSDMFSGSNVVRKPVIDGEFIHIFNPNDTRFEEDTTWYTNDHCFAKDASGIWHASGIIGHHPVRPWGGETKFFHVSSDALLKEKWNDHDYSMVTEPGKERVLWAPHIYQENGTNYLFYNIGNMQDHAPDYCSWGQLCLATSKNMYDWERHDRNPLFSDPGHARDSYIMKHNGIYYFYYTRAFNEVDHRSCVAVRTSHNLLEWSGPEIVHIQPYENYWAGDAESPFVVSKDGLFYLFICRALTAYNETHVYWSEDPLSFPVGNFVTALPVHACEIMNEGDKWFISNTGWDKKGLFVANLRWE